MGESLAAHRPDFMAIGRDWRTPPLWGISLMKTVNGDTNLLHDGRARREKLHRHVPGGSGAPIALPNSL